MKYLRRRFLTGLLILLPAVVTGWLMWKVFTSVDSVLQPIQERYPIIDFPGVGFAIVILIIMFVGIFAGNFIGRRVIAQGERILYRLPFIRRIYIAVKELSEVFLADRKMVFKEVVVIRYPHPGSFALGFVTETGTRTFNETVGTEVLNIFIPTTPNPTSGFLLFVPSADVMRLPVSVEEGLKMVVSGGVFIPGPLVDDAPADAESS
jgi:uncharacterized membrane protein